MFIRTAILLIFLIFLLTGDDFTLFKDAMSIAAMIAVPMFVAGLLWKSLK